MKLTLKEMNGLLNGKCLPSDLIVGETLAEYLVRKFTELEQKLAESQREFRAADATIENQQMQLEKLAADNAYLLNGAARELNTSWMFHKTMLGAQAALVCLSHGYQAAAREWLEGTTDEAGAEIPDDISVGELHEWFDSQMVSNDGKSGFLTRGEAEVKIRAECPATDAFLAEVRAQGRNEGINYAAGRLAAAFNHGFVDKPLAEVFDVVRMIMDTKEELANSILPAADGLSGGYAEKFLTEFAGYARKGKEPDEGQSFLSDEDCQAFVKAFTKGVAQ